MTEESLVPYGDMMEDALRGVMRRALALVEERGLPGSHHYYITFRTRADGVAMPDELRARYPDAMTIVLQNKFWGLETGEDSFSVTLSFAGRSERLTVPFRAVTAFADPAVDFGLRFGPEAAGEGGQEDAPDADERERDEDGGDGGDDAGPAIVVALDRFRKT